MQFRRWALSGLWDVLLAALNESGEGRDSVQTIDLGVPVARVFGLGRAS